MMMTTIQQQHHSRAQVRRRRSGRRGSSITEFALIAPMLFGMLVGSFKLASGVSRLVQASSVCRNANLFMVRGFDLARPDNQKLLLRTAAGLGLSKANTHTANPTGKAVVYLTKVVKLGVNACAQGVPNWNGDPGTCPNYQKYVIASRVAIGNSARWPSVIGDPASLPSRKGELSLHDIAMVPGNRAASFSDLAGQESIVRLHDDEVAYVSEVYADATDLNVPFLIQMDTIRVRNVS